MTRKESGSRDRRYVVLSFPKIPRRLRYAGVIVSIIVGSNLISHHLLNPESEVPFSPLEEEPLIQTKSLYLLEKASLYIKDLEGFERKLRQISAQLEIPPEWLMAVIYAESAFDPSVHNHQGSGAVGLIQFMPATAQSLYTSPERLHRMDAVHQLEYVYLYLRKMQERQGRFESLTDLYLSILYPKARKQDYCYTLYAQPALAYRQNSILDENKDGRVTITDIDRRMKRLFPTAYHEAKNTT